MVHPTHHLSLMFLADSSYWFLSIGYFNIVLPSFLPGSICGGPEEQHPGLQRTFWHRALCAKAQTSRYIKSPMLLYRSREMARQRECSAKVWAKEDDEELERKKAGGKQASVKPVSPPVQAPNPPKAASGPPKKPPSSALIGLSLLGDLDRVFHHSQYPCIRLNALTPGSRVRGGGTLLFGYTFAGKLWLNLPWDLNGFGDGVIDAFWKELVLGVEEFLMD